MTSRRCDHPSHRALAGVLAVLALGNLVGADETAPPPASLESQILARDADLERRIVGLSRVRFAYPTDLTASAGLLFSRLPREFDCTTVCTYRGYLLQVEPGLRGGQISAGYALVNGEKRRNRHLLSRVYLGYGVKGTILRSWGRSRLDPDDQTLAGVEGEFTVIGINFSLGVLRGLRSDDDPWVVSGSVGWGF